MRIPLSKTNTTKPTIPRTIDGIIGTMPNYMFARFRETPAGHKGQPDGHKSWLCKSVSSICFVLYHGDRRAESSNAGPATESVSRAPQAMTATFQDADGRSGCADMPRKKFAFRREPHSFCGSRRPIARLR